MPTGKKAAPSKRDITKLICVLGLAGEYYVRTSGFAGLDEIPLSSKTVGDAIVRALRDEAAKHPELMPEPAPPKARRTR